MWERWDMYLVGSRTLNEKTMCFERRKRMGGEEDIVGNGVSRNKLV
jgi:hypothetical protein